MAQKDNSSSEALDKAKDDSLMLCKRYRHEYLMPEHLLFGFIKQAEFQGPIMLEGGNPDDMLNELTNWLQEQPRMPEGVDYNITPSYQYCEVVHQACMSLVASEEEQLDVPHFVNAMFDLPDSEAAYLLNVATNGDRSDFISLLIDFYASGEEDDDDDEEVVDLPFGDEYPDDDEEEVEQTTGKKDKRWRKYVTCISDIVDQHNPLIGREKELDRTIQVLCRKDKNNPLHVGEAGVGKTALVYGLAKLINDGKVPERLKGSKIYQMDMGQMLAGTQFRGDFEKRIKMVMDGVTKEGNDIVYLDEIHNIVGAGAGSDGGPDASNILKPYLEKGDIRFIGATTFAEYNKRIARSKALVRRFQEIDIPEPSVDEAIQILKGLQKQYEHFHHVCYRPEAIEFAVRASAKFITDRFLPDKAIDLIDEAGAYLELHPNNRSVQWVTKALIVKMLQRVCKIDASVLREESNKSLSTLRERMKTNIYGQDEAVQQVVEAVEMAKAGLSEEDKPLASLLFVGPTGVGKTEVAKVLAKELGVELIRFDMSEYTEKHTVAKLIGSPAGYVGYDDGGLLTDAVRKHPNCVLLLDEIEKAHSDIYNILLQVMDYASLTDNHGQKADFRQVVLIMTSNAGAQYASQAGVGFSSHVSRGEAMLKQVKRTFKPEFLNRLTAQVVFHDMNEQMATMVLDKFLGILRQQLAARHVELTLTPAAHAWLLKKGFTPEYGAREMERTVNHSLKPLLTHEILYGKLQKGGRVTADVGEGKIVLKYNG